MTFWMICTPKNSFNNNNNKINNNKNNIYQFKYKSINFFNRFTFFIEYF